MRLKHQTRLSLLLLATFLLVAGGSVAYFVTTETAHSVVSTSGVAIELYELAGPEESIPFSDLENVLPGVTYSKIPYVENVDTEPVWVRAKITLKKTVDGTETVIDDYASMMELGGIGANWAYKEDGFYYYSSALNSGEATEPIFQTVIFTDDMASEYQDAVYSLTVTAEATQVANNGTSAENANWTGGEE